MKLFSVAKVGLYCESVTHSTEKRKDGEEKVLILTLRVEPFDARLASSVRDVVRQDLFKLNHPDPKPEVDRLVFRLGVPRQVLTLYATPDTVKPSIALHQGKITGTYARASSDSRTFVWIFKFVFGPVGARELEYVEAWRNTMAFGTFEPAQASAEFEEVEPEDTEDDAQPRLPTPEFDTDPDGRPTDQEPVNRPLHSHSKGRQPRDKRMAKATTAPSRTPH